MDKLAAAFLATLLGAASAAHAIEPMKGSITYGGHQVYIARAPIGSTFEHRLIGPGGDKYKEIYRINEERGVDLVSRTIVGER